MRSAEYVLRMDSCNRRSGEGRRTHSQAGQSGTFRIHAARSRPAMRSSHEWAVASHGWVSCALPPAGSGRHISMQFSRRTKFGVSLSVLSSSIDVGVSGCFRGTPRKTRLASRRASWPRQQLEWKWNSLQVTTLPGKDTNDEDFHNEFSIFPTYQFGSI